MKELPEACPDCQARLRVEPMGEFELSYVCPRPKGMRRAFAEGLLEAPPSVGAMPCEGCGAPLGPEHEPALSERQRLDCPKCGFTGERMAPG